MQIASKSHSTIFESMRGEKLPLPILVFNINVYYETIALLAIIAVKENCIQIVEKQIFFGEIFNLGWNTFIFAPNLKLYNCEHVENIAFNNSALEVHQMLTTSFWAAPLRTV